jgi:transposase-like protein
MPKKFSKEQRLAIGQQIYNDEITVNEAASRYDISPYTARDYMRFFPRRQSSGSQEQQTLGS